MGMLIRVQWMICLKNMWFLCQWRNWSHFSILRLHTLILFYNLKKKVKNKTKHARKSVAFISNHNIIFNEGKQFLLQSPFQRKTPKLNSTLLWQLDFSVRSGDWALFLGLGHSSPIKDVLRETLFNCCMYKKSRNCRVSTESCPRRK